MMAVLTDRVERLRRQLPYMPWILRLVWQASPRHMMLWLFLIILNGVIPVAIVYLTKDVVDQLVNLANLTPETMVPAAINISIFASLYLLQILIRAGLSYVNTAQTEHIRDHINHLIHRKAATLDLSFFDTTEFYDKLHRAYVDTQGRPSQLLMNLGDIVTNIITISGMIVILISYVWWLPLVIIVQGVVVMAILLRHSVRYKRWRDANTFNERRSEYYGWLQIDRSAAAELRLFDLSTHFSKSFDELRGQLRTERLELERDKTLAQLSTVLIGGLTTGVIMAWLGWRVIQGQLTVGDLAVFVQIFGQGQSLIRVMLNNATNIYQNILFIANLHTFLQLAPTLQDPEHPVDDFVLTDSIQFENITFTYPGNHQPAIRNFSWTIPAGMTVALIGENGEGKSTLVKLLCRFYDPDEGRILWDGVDIRSLPITTLRQHVSVLFQEPIRYSETVADNISISTRHTAARAAIQEAALTAGAAGVIDKLPEGYDTMLGRWFDGQELSIGQWQRVALARAFLRDCDILLLDEPTSAMDAWVEADWLTRFREIAIGKTAIMITHRFTTALYADRIDVMKDGTIIESGSHDELLAQKGRYAQSWYDQTGGTPLTQDLLINEDG